MNKLTLNPHVITVGDVRPVNCTNFEISRAICNLNMILINNI